MKYVVESPLTAGSVRTCVEAFAGMLRFDAEVVDCTVIPGML